MQRLSIGQMARINGVSEKTLRLYHEIGILIPVYVDPHSGYRYYDIMQSSQLDLIQTLKDIGVPLRQIKTLQDNKDINRFREAMVKSRRRIKERQREMDLAMHTVENLLQSVDIYQNHSCQELFSLKHFPARPALKFDTYQIREEGGEPLELWERYLRQVKSAMVKKGIPLSLFHHVGRIIPLESLKNRDFETCSALVFVDDHFHEAPFMVIPEGMYLTMCCNKMLDKDGNCYARKCLPMILDEAENRNYEIIGDFIGEVLVESAALNFVGRDMMMELQVPVKQKE